MSASPLDLSVLLPGLRLANAWALALLALLPIWWWVVLRGGRHRGGLRFPHAALGELPRSWRIRLLPLPDLLRMLALAALILAVARPQLGREREKITQAGVDIMLALDVSASMLAEDIAPNRIEAAKVTILRFVRRLTTDRVGLVVFAGRSFTQCPLTTDYAMVMELVRECRINMVVFDGTAIGDALANCVYRLGDAAERTAPEPSPKAEPAPAPEGAARSRVIVFLTDGSNNAGRLDPRTAAQMAKVKGIKVHCIGLGSPAGAPVPYVDEYGRRRYLQNERGQLLITRLDEARLKEIAALTGGEYFSARSAQALEAIYRRIAAMEKHDIEVRKLTRYDEQFLLPVLLGLAVLLLELLLRATVLRVTS